MGDFTLPAFEVPESRRARARLRPRYEDVAQDGELRLDALPHALAAVFWQSAWPHQPMNAALSREGIVPILRRAVMRGTQGPVSVIGALEVEGAFRLARSRGRFLLEVQARVFGARGRTYGPPVSGAGEQILLGEIHAEHVLTRLFAEPERRRVEELPAEAGDVTLEVPWVEGPAVKPTHREEVDFGLRHTDSNRHVNSLVYARRFEEAVLTARAASGESTEVLMRELHAVWRKPCFAGERVGLVVELDGDDARGGFVGEDPRPRCTLEARLGTPRNP